MQIKTLDGGTLASVKGTFEEAYNLAMVIWEHAGDEGVHMDGLDIWDDDTKEVVKVLSINYCTHER